jgi:hypothetical protein
MTPVLLVLLSVLGVVVVAIQIAEPAVDRVRARRRPAPVAPEADARERIVAGVGIR